MRLIDADVFWRKLTSKCEEDWVDLMVVYELLEELPSTEPERKWIPCSERLPEKPEGINEMYLAQNSWGVFAVLGWADGWNCHYNADGDVDREYEMRDVIAWQPLPEPYKGAKMEGEK